MNILVTGGAGYIGSHTVVELLRNNHEVVIVDNLSNSHKVVMKRIKKITDISVPLEIFDVEDSSKLEDLFAKYDFEAVIHFAGLKAVGESTANPLRYYGVNLGSSVSLMRVMEKYGVSKLVFSSSATVYGSAPIPYKEDVSAGLGITNPYGRTKYMTEQIMKDVASTHPDYHFTTLRYFNPIGAHDSGLIGEQPQGVPNNLMPYITQVATGEREKLLIFGDNYKTVDGTGVRDYIHVTDLARGHVAALNRSKPGFNAYNLGTGSGTSVLELVHAFEEASGVNIPYEIAERRPGDLPEYYADVQKATKELGWRAEKSIADSCSDSWRWQRNNPNGYE